MEHISRVTDRKKSLSYAIVAVLIWSTVATAFKIGLRELHYSQLIFIASGVSLLFMLIYLIANKQFKILFLTSPKDLLRSAITGALNPFAYYLILFKAYSLLPAQLAQPLNMIWPVTLAVLSVPLLKQRIRWYQYLALFVCFAGIAILSSQGSIKGFGTTNVTGVLLALGSSVFWALYWIMNVRDPRPEAVKLFFSFLFGFIYLIIFLPFVSDFHFHGGTSLWAAIYIGVFEAGITYLIWMKAMQLSDNTAVTGSLVYFTPFLSLILISNVLGEKIHVTTIIGLILIAAGIIYQQLHK